jgi:GT2 family glycosyltransferase
MMSDGDIGSSILCPISVVIPTFNRGSLLRDCLRSCYKFRGGVEVEFIVVIDGSTDGTLEMLISLRKEIPCLSWMCTANKGPGSARNAGVALAKHETVLFIGDDIVPSNDQFFITHSRLHGSYGSNRFAVLGKCVWPSSANYEVNAVMRHIQGRGGEQFGYADLPPYAWVDWRFFYTSNISLKKSVVKDWPSVGFNTKFSLAAFEDAELAYRLSKELGGFKIFYDPGSVGQHFHFYSVHSFIARQVASGRMAAVAISLHPELQTLLNFDELTAEMNKEVTASSEEHMSDYIAAIDGIKAWARILESKGVLGRESWHEDLLFAVFEMSFLQGYMHGQALPETNFAAGYSYILARGIQKLHRVIHHEITAHDYFKRDLLKLA